MLGDVYLPRPVLQLIAFRTHTENRCSALPVKPTMSRSASRTICFQTNDPLSPDAFSMRRRKTLPPSTGPSEPSPILLTSQCSAALCHSQSLTSAASPYTGMSNAVYHPYSDFAIHHIGSSLDDGIYQGNGVSDEFRTAPLQGLGQRLFFLHDGRTSDLMQAIAAHACGNGPGGQQAGPSSGNQ